MSGGMADSESNQQKHDGLWSKDATRKEQLRVALAIAAIAASYYSSYMLMPDIFSATRTVLNLVGAILVICWILYFVLAAVATLDDLHFRFFDEGRCRYMLELAHLFYYVGAVCTLVVFVAYAALVIVLILVTLLLTLLSTPFPVA
jgi:hypothetical protein